MSSQRTRGQWLLTLPLDDITVGTHLPMVPLCHAPDDADRRVPVFLRMRTMPSTHPSEAGTLLRILFVRFGRLSFDANRAGMLRGWCAAERTGRLTRYHASQRNALTSAVFIAGTCTRSLRSASPTAVPPCRKTILSPCELVNVHVATVRQNSYVLVRLYCINGV